MGLAQELFMFERLHGWRSGRFVPGREFSHSVSGLWQKHAMAIHVNRQLFHLLSLLCNYSVPFVGPLRNMSSLSKVILILKEFSKSVDLNSQ